ncbi:thiamine transporter thi7 [Pichia californica]|nr:thiamine transporter thi7 [[Candida] californica]
MEVIRKIDNFIRLDDSSVLQNPDLVPVLVKNRKWGTMAYISYWGLNGLCIATWSGASSLISLGLNGNQTMGVIVVGQLLISAATVFNGLYGAKYHIGYSVYQRIIFGIRGSNFGVLIRSLLSVVWFASQAWIGGLCVNIILSSWSSTYLNWKNTLPESVNMTSKELCGFVVYLAISLPVLMIRPQNTEHLLTASSLAIFFVGMGTTIWAVKQNGNTYGSLLSQKMELSSSDLGWAWIYGLSSWYSSLVAGISNQSDYSRFTKSTKSALVGTLIGTNVLGFIIPIFAILTASALYETTGEYFWMPTDICDYWLQTNYSPKSRAAAFFCGLAMVISQLGINCVGNGLSGGMDLAFIFPRYINIRRGAFIVFLLTWPTQPWLFYNSSSTFVVVMSSFSVFVTPLVAIFMTDFIFVRRGVIKLSDCYNMDESSLYWYWHGINIRSFVAFTIGFAPALPGLINACNETIYVNTGSQNFYKGSFIFQYVVTSTCYYLLCYFFKVNVGERDENDIYNTFNDQECKKYNIIPYDKIEKSNSSDVEPISIEYIGKNASYYENTDIKA